MPRARHARKPRGWGQLISSGRRYTAGGEAEQMEAPIAARARTVGFRRQWMEEGQWAQVPTYRADVHELPQLPTASCSYSGPSSSHAGLRLCFLRIGTPVPEAEARRS